MAMAAMGQRERAEATVRARLETSPTPTMWLHLGDLTGDPHCFETAWDLSEGKLARAKLRLGSLAMKAEKWDEARAHLQQALAVKPHYAEAWFCCAVCRLKLDQTEGAIEEFRKVVALDATHHQAWSSLGGLFAKRKMKREALYAFREACRLRGDDAQLWQHAALAALDVGFFEEALYLASRNLALGGSPLPQVSSLLAQAVASDVAGTDGRRARRLLERTRTLLAQSCAARPTDAIHWEARLHLDEKCGTEKDTKGTLREQLGAYQRNAPWKEDASTLDTTVEVAAQLVEKLLDSGDHAEFVEARKLVEHMYHHASDKLAATQGAESLRMLQAKIQRHGD
jgi:tetratricopeptide (TPR) repeat protein